MTNLTIFNFEGQEIRTFLLENTPWFIAKDIATILGYVDTAQAVRQHIDEEDTLTDIELTKKAQELSQSNFNSVPRAIYTNEAGVYQLIFGSTRPEAKTLKRWLAHEVLPSIRKTGQYSTSQFNATQPTLSVNDIKRFAGIAGQLNKLPDSELKSVLQSQLMANLTKSQSPKQTDDEILLEKILAKTPHTGVTASELRRNIRAFRDTPTSEINDLIQILVKSGRGYTKQYHKCLKFFRGQDPNNIILD